MGIHGPLPSHAPFHLYVVRCLAHMLDHETPALYRDKSCNTVISYVSPQHAYTCPSVLQSSNSARKVSSLVTSTEQTLPVSSTQYHMNRGYL